MRQARFLGALLASALRYALSLDDGGAVCRAGGRCEGGGVESGGAEQHFWSWRGGNALASSFTPHVGPDITKPPAWVWPNSDDELHRHGPAIDGEGSIFTVTAQGWVRKFSQDGDILWSWRTRKGEGQVVTCLSLYNNSVHLMSTGVHWDPGASGFRGGVAFALSKQTGELLWRADIPPDNIQHVDSHSVFATEGVLLAGFRNRFNPLGRVWQVHSADTVVALSAADGSHLWDYTLEGQVWNFMPSTPGDGTMLIATNCGRAYRLDLRSGRLIWKAPFDEPGNWCSTGGGVLGPDGRYYVTTSHHSEKHTGRGDAGFEDVAPCHATEAGYNCPGGRGLLLVYRVSDGAVELRRRISAVLNQYPAVGMVSGRLAVVVAMGENPSMPWEVHHRVIKSHLPTRLKEDTALRWKMFRWQYRHAWFRRLLGFYPKTGSSIAALDAQTGEAIWTFEEAPWDHFSADGDEEGYERRSLRKQRDHMWDEACMPDSWAIPVVAGDGTVYAGSGRTGNLYALRDSDGDGKLGLGEVRSFHAGSGFLNGPALAPGLLAAAPCWGPMHVFRNAT